jgi:hypothetical protein
MAPVFVSRDRSWHDRHDRRDHEGRIAELPSARDRPNVAALWTDDWLLNRMLGVDSTDYGDSLQERHSARSECQCDVFAINVRTPVT